MLRKFFITMGMVATSILGLSIGAFAYAYFEAPYNEAVAVNATRDLARSWRIIGLKKHFASSVVQEINFDEAQRSIDNVKWLGPFKFAKTIQETQWHFDTGKSTATVVMVAAFENGDAKVIVDLLSDGAAMKVLNLQVMPTWQRVKLPLRT